MNQSHDASALRAQYDQDPQALYDAGWTFSWWYHGGGPGADWQSDKIQLVVGDGKVGGSYVRARKVPKNLSRSQATKFVAPVPAMLAKSIFDAVFSTRLYEKAFPSEDKKIGDAMKQTFEFGSGGYHLTKTLIEPEREELPELWSACEAVLAELERSGTPEDVSPKYPPTGQ